MKHYVLSLVSLLFMQMHLFAGNRQLSDTIHAERWSTTTSSWDKYYYSKYYANPTCEWTDSVYTSVWNTSTNTYDYNTKTCYSMNANNTINYYTSYSYSGGVFNPYYKGIYVYSGSKNTEFIFQLWKTHLNAFRNDSRNVYHFGSLGLTDTVFYLAWDTVAINWKPNTKTVSVYNSDSTTSATYSYRYIPSTSTYMNTSKYDYSYNGAKKLTTYVYYTWDTTTSTWSTKSRYTYGYNAFNQSTSFLSETWDNVASVWKNAYKYEYTLNANGQTTFEQDYAWETATSSWKANYRYIYVLGCLVLNGIEDVLRLSMEVYPNPTASLLSFDVPVSAGFTQVEITDITGRTLLSDVPKVGQNTLNIESLNAGQYFIHFMGENGKVTRTFIKH